MRVVGGVGENYRRIPLAKFDWSWPFAQAELREDALHLTLRGPFRRIRPLRIPLGDIERIGVRRAWRIGRMYIHLRRPARYGRLWFSAFEPGFSELLNLLRERGVNVAEGPISRV